MTCLGTCGTPPESLISHQAWGCLPGARWRPRDKDTATTPPTALASLPDTSFFLLFCWSRPRLLQRAVPIFYHSHFLHKCHPREKTLHNSPCVIATLCLSATSYNNMTKLSVSSTGIISLPVCCHSLYCFQSFVGPVPCITVSIIFPVTKPQQTYTQQTVAIEILTGLTPLLPPVPSWGFPRGQANAADGLCPPELPGGRLGVLTSLAAIWHSPKFLPEGEVPQSCETCL